MISEGLREINGTFPVSPPGNKREGNDDPGQKRRGYRYHRPLQTMAYIDYRDRKQVDCRDHSHATQEHWPRAADAAVIDQTPADTTVPAIGRSPETARRSSRRRNRKCLRRVNSTSGRQTGPVSRWRISKCQNRFDRL